ncbi:SseB family protein [uncultured Methanobrevibacter sp.]|uniref:SseB family protein n=1 Tax=uncultured Methanobrevibacter sp. TaxID=253161 RepID=UPI002604C279|nr:SseB family protein [uncultured Methanobrevibacter sp.]
MTSTFSNHYLIKSIKDLENLGNDIAEPRVVTDFIFELKVSNLFIPGIDNGEELVYETLVDEDTDQVYLPLFSSEEEFYKHYDKDSEYEPIPNEFEIYGGIAADEIIEGIIIDVESLCFEVPKEIIEFAMEDFTISFDDIETRSLDEIKAAYESVSNEDLIKFISDASNRDDYEGIMVELSNSTPLNLVVSSEPLDEFAKDGVIEAKDVDGFSLCTLEDGESRYGIIFTDKDAIGRAALKDSEMSYYAQLTKVSELFDFVLRNDMDGVIINPYGEEYTIPRSELLSQASGIELIVEDHSFRNCLDYAFLL